MRRNTPLRTFAVCVLPLLGAALFDYAQAGGGISETLRLPAQRGISTRPAQNGLTLLAVQRGDREGRFVYAVESRPSVWPRTQNVEAYAGRDATGLWIAPGRSVAPDRYDGRPRAFDITACSSTGDNLRLPWRTVGGMGSEPALLFVTIPTGYPDTYRYLDVSVRHRSSGDTARWRITRLPRMRRADPAPSATPAEQVRHGIRVRAEARRWPNSSQVFVGTRITVPANTPNQWEVLQGSVASEWVPFSFREQTAPDPAGGSRGRLTKGSESGAAGSAFDSPYRNHNRFVRLTTFVRRFETHNETVRFQNVRVEQHGGSLYLTTNKTQTITTPSGIRLTLPAQGPPKGDGGNFVGEPFSQVSYRMDVAPEPSGRDTFLLPESPLCARYGRPVRLELRYPPRTNSYGWSKDNRTGERTYFVDFGPFKKNVSHRLREFSVIVRQQLDFETLPFTVAAPIEDAPLRVPPALSPGKPPRTALAATRDRE